MSTTPEEEEDTTMPDAIDVLVPPNPDEPAKPAEGKRPTTRAGRRAASEARKAAGGDARPKAKATPATAPRRAPLEGRLATSFVSLGTAVMATGHMVGSEAVKADGLLVVQQSADLAAALDQVAKGDPRVAKALERMLTVGTYGALIGAVTPLAVGIAANHGLIPGQVAQQLGVEVPQQSAPAPDFGPPPSAQQMGFPPAEGPGGPIY